MALLAKRVSWEVPPPIRSSVSSASLYFSICARISSQRSSSIPLWGIRNSYSDVPKAGGRGAVSRAHGLRGLALAANGVAGVPEFGGDAAIAGILQHAYFFALADLPPQLAAKLEVVAPVINRPAPVGLHVDAVVRIGDQVLRLPGAGQEADVGHPDQRDTIPSVGPHGSVG